MKCVHSGPGNVFAISTPDLSQIVFVRLVPLPDGSPRPSSLHHITLYYITSHDITLCYSIVYCIIYIYIHIYIYIYIYIYIVLLCYCTIVLLPLSGSILPCQTAVICRGGLRALRRTAAEHIHIYTYIYIYMYIHIYIYVERER